MADFSLQNERAASVVVRALLRYVEKLVTSSLLCTIVKQPFGGNMEESKYNVT